MTNAIRDERPRPGRATVSPDRLLSVEEARDGVIAAIAGPTAAEVAWLTDALGRVAAEAVTSPIALPPWDNSAMDGYAIRAADVAGATETEPASLTVIGEVRAGQSPEVGRSSAARRSGSPPARRSRRGADAVVQVELTTPARRRRARRRDRAVAMRPGPPPAGILVHEAVPAGRFHPAARQRPRGRRHDPRSRARV